MSKQSSPRASSISRARSLKEIADFWDTHSLADYWDQTSEVEFEVRAKRRSRAVLNQSEQGESKSQAHNKDKL